MKKLTNVQVNTSIDSQTGEVFREERQYTYSLPQEPNFIKVYLDNILYLKDIPKKNSGVLFELMKVAHYADHPGGGMMIFTNAAMLRMIATTLQVTEKSVRNAISDLTKGQALIRKERGTYLLNPYLFGKGDWKDIAKIRLTVDFSPNGKSLSAVFETAETTAEEKEPA